MPDTTSDTVSAAPFDPVALRTRLEARFAPGWPAQLGVPDAWLPHLARLDEQLAALDPDYQVAQVKTKWRGLRYYRQDVYELPCCALWEETHPSPADDGEAEAIWAVASAVHEADPGHLAAEASKETLVEQMDALIHAAEEASYDWEL